MPYGLMKMVLFGLLAGFASLIFDAQSSTIPPDPQLSPAGIYPNGGTDPPG